ncbi:hypothetical protein BDD12DRAFT_444924 [Trichophaea hybrida]|nr:hypothetical protein BDD12DRAFT_444924 [Trichophaea hybrida]
MKEQLRQAKEGFEAAKRRKKGRERRRRRDDSLGGYMSWNDHCYRGCRNIAHVSGGRFGGRAGLQRSCDLACVALSVQNAYYSLGYSTMVYRASITLPVPKSTIARSSKHAGLTYFHVMWQVTCQAAIADRSATRFSSCIACCLVPSFLPSPSPLHRSRAIFSHA